MSRGSESACNYDLGMSEFWVYEDMVVHTATTHRADCRYCNSGQGQWGARDERASTWHGPYSSKGAAKSAPIKTNSLPRDCGTCLR